MKICYIDTETTGVEPGRHGLIQVALIIEIDGKVEGEYDFRMRPFPSDAIDPKALEVNKIASSDLPNLPDPKEMHRHICTLLNQYVNRFDMADKFTPAGFNVGFDLGFLRAFFLDNKNSYFGSYFNYRAVDPLPLLYWLRFAGAIDLPDYKLATVCEHFGIKLGEDAHDAMADIRATRELIQLLGKQFENWRMER